MGCYTGITLLEEVTSEQASLGSPYWSDIAPFERPVGCSCWSLILKKKGSALRLTI